MGRDFDDDLSSLRWAIDAYVFALSALVVTFGVIADRWGRRRVFMAGLTGFTVASLFCGTSDSPGTLDIARMVQGACGAAVLAPMLVLIGEEFTGRARERAVAAWASTAGAAVVTSCLVGGLANWRAIFLVNVPLGTLALVLTYTHVRPGKDGPHRPPDLRGLLTLSAGLGLLTAGLLRGTETNWRDPLGVTLVTCAGLLSALLLPLPRRHARTLYRNRRFVGLSAITLTLGAGMFSMLHVLTCALPLALGATARQSGLRLLPFTVPVLIVPAIATSLGLPVVSRRAVGTGLTLVVGGLLPLLTAGTHTSWLRLVPDLLIAGIGAGLAIPGIAATALAAHPEATGAPTFG